MMYCNHKPLIPLGAQDNMKGSELSTSTFHIFSKCTQPHLKALNNDYQKLCGLRIESTLPFAIPILLLLAIFVKTGMLITVYYIGLG